MIDPPWQVQGNAVASAPREYPEELRERAIRMAVDVRRDPATRVEALRRIADQLGTNKETLRNRVHVCRR